MKTMAGGGWIQGMGMGRRKEMGGGWKEKKEGGRKKERNYGGR